MTLELYSTLGRASRPFKPLDGRVARIYVCGVTPYDVTHLGHAFSYVQFDTLRRYLKYLGWGVKYVQNVTDIDDDMIMVSRRQNGRPISEIRDENDAIFRNDLDRLNVLRPDAYPFATDHIPQIIENTQRILDHGNGYVVDGDVFFDASSFRDYGQLNGVEPSEMAKWENPEAKHAEKRRSALDFLLWQTVDEGDPSWDSPWGPGRPGWSIECTAMSTTHLGPQIDIHGGGRDLMFPHHENEIAQAETAFGVSPFCGWWMHNGMLRLDGVKMSKSLGNLVLVRNLLERFDPDQLRLYLLNTHYRVDADYHNGDLDALGERFERLATVARRPDAATSSTRSHPIAMAFEATVNRDFNVGAGLGILDAAAGRVLAGIAATGEAAAIKSALEVLGFAFAGARGPATGDFQP